MPRESWEDRIAKSAEKHYEAELRVMEEALGVGEVPAALARAVGLGRAGQWSTAIQRATEVCQSPIEEALVGALLADSLCDEATDTWFWVARFGRWLDFTRRRNEPPDFDRTEPEARRVRMQPQASVGRYRADCLVTLEDIFPGPDNKGFVAKKTAVVEADGHDYHDRTKEQAASDRKRDRALQSDGYFVLRYTGADIWRDPLGCAADVFDTLRKAAEAEAE